MLNQSIISRNVKFLLPFAKLSYLVVHMLYYSFAAQHHLQALLKQLVEQDGLTQEWKDVIMPIVWRISEQVFLLYLRQHDLNFCIKLSV